MAEQIALNTDCMAYMRTLPDKSFDLAIADPPYFSGSERRGYYGCKVSPIGVRRDYPISPKWDIPTAEFFKELERVAKKYIVWGCNYFDYVFTPGRIVWDKCNGESSFSDCEIAATNCHDSVRLFRYMWCGMMQGKSIKDGGTQQGNKALNEKRIHPTQKPVALYEWLIQKYAKRDGNCWTRTWAAAAAVSQPMIWALTLLAVRSSRHTFSYRKNALRSTRLR